MGKFCHAIVVPLLMTASLSAASADTTGTVLSGSWQKIASAGQTVDVQGTGGIVNLTTSATAAPSPTAADVLVPGDHRFYSLTLDLYARTPAGGSVVVLTGVNGPVATAIPAGIATGQVKIAVTGTAVQLPGNALLNGIAVKARSTNAANGFVGSAGVATTFDGTGSGYPLEPGAAASFAVSNSNAVWINGTAGDVFSFEGN